MCGIIGWLRSTTPQSQRIALDMLEQIRHRGPDAGYLHIEDDVLFGVRRLAIVNVERGRQPAFSEDEKVVAVFNGEIYNHVELKAELETRGHRVAEGSDVEIIPHAYEEWGLDFPSRFNGDFAIALYDRRARRLVLCRDRLGIKPLYYTQGPSGLLFASEIKALFAHPDVERRLDPGFLTQLFTFWSGPLDGSPFAGVLQIPPGTVAAFDRDGRPTATRKYWEIPFRETVPKFVGDFADCRDAFRDQMRRSVRLRLQADVEVGTYTSGGIDSAVINVVAHQDLRHRGTQTFSVGFDDPDFDESPHQEVVARHLGLQSNRVVCARADIYRRFADVIHHAESPIFRTAPSAMFLLSDLVRQRGIKVVLTGEGADEVAWGYDLFREAKIRRFWSRQPNSSARGQLFRKLYAYLPQFQNRRHFNLLVDFFRRDMEKTGAPLYSHQTRIANSSASHALLSADMRRFLETHSPQEALLASLPPDYARRSLLERCQFLEMRTLLAGYLLNSQGDRMLSAHGVEGRFPFLDHHVIEFLAGVPENHKLRGLRDKAIVRETFRRDLPESIFNRPKFAFRAPELKVFVDDADGLVRFHLSESALADAGVFDAAAVGHFVERLARTPAERHSTRDNLAFIQILSTQMLHHQFVRRFDSLEHRPRAQDVTITRRALVANGGAPTMAARSVARLQAR